MVWAETAVVGTAVRHLGTKGQGDGPGLVVLAIGDVGLRIPVDQRLERSAYWTTFAHVDLVVAQDHVCIDHTPAVGTDAPRELVEYIVGVGLMHRGSRRGCTGG